MPKMLPYLTRPLTWLARILAYVVLGAVHCYRLCIAPVLPIFGIHCRFQPSCSQYAITALHCHGGFYGSWLVLKRLARCRPHLHECYGKSHGYDPVPDPQANIYAPFSPQSSRDKP